MTSEEWAFEKINGTFGLALYDNLFSLKCETYEQVHSTNPHITQTIRYHKDEENKLERILFISGLNYSFIHRFNKVYVYCHSTNEMEKLVKCLKAIGRKSVWHKTYWENFGNKYGIK